MSFAVRPIPRNHDEVTAEWLTAAMRSGGLDVEVSGFRREPLGEGVGMMSDLERVHLEYGSGTGPASVIVKLQASTEANRAVGIAFNTYLREVFIYRDIAKLTPAGTPTIYLAEIDGAADFAIVMEDCGEYRLGDQLTGCNPEDAKLAVVELGKLHAAFWNKVDDDPVFDFIPYHRGSYHGNALRDGAAAGWDTMVANFPGVVPDWMQAAKDRYLAAIEPMQDWMSERPHTVVHGDFRMDNLFFGTKPEHHPMVILDWQGPLRCKPLHDLAYFLSQSLPVEDRRADERDLVASWHATLVENGVTGYSGEQAWEDYKRAVFYIWTVAVVIAGSLEPGNERGTAWMTKMLERNLAAIQDHGLMALLDEYV